MSTFFAHPLMFLRRATTISIVLAFLAPTAWGATSAYENHDPYTREEPLGNGFLFRQG